MTENPWISDVFFFGVVLLDIADEIKDSVLELTVKSVDDGQILKER